MSMLNLSLKTFAAGVLIIFGSVVFASCDKAQRDVVADNIMESIDNALGKYDVALKRVENGYDSMKKSRDALQKGMIKAQVQSERAQEDVDKARKLVENAKKTGKSIMEKINAGEFPVTMANGKSYEKAELVAAAQKVGDRLKVAETTLAGMEATYNTYNTAQSRLKSQFDAASKKLDQMKPQINVLQAKIATLQAQREAASIAGDAGASIADQFENLQGEMDDLFAEAETELRVGEAAWKAMEDEMTDDDDLLAEFQTSDDQLQNLEGMFD
ncbi:MAG: PspA/IM30 family protein [Phycisphaerales bacterium]|nr:PspA/IM30 family protein [Phycisphaerales bacterium]